MVINYEFLLSRINELELKVFELESKVKELENSKQIEEHIKLNEVKPNTRIEKYLFDGKCYKKSRLVLAVINKYVKDNPNISAEELEQAFPSSEFKLSTFKCVIKDENIPAKHRKPVKRYFIDEDEIELKDGTMMAVCTQWGKENIGLFIEYVEKYGYVIKLD